MRAGEQAPGTPVYPAGPVRRTSIPARSGSRSSIAATIGLRSDSRCAEIAAVIALCRGIMLRRKVPSHRVLGHSDVAPARKKDPGEKFPWHSLANSGVGHWVQPAPIVRDETLKLGSISDDVASMQTAFARYGYNIPTHRQYDGATMEVVTASSTTSPRARQRRRRSFDHDHAARAAGELAGRGDGEVAAK